MPFLATAAEAEAEAGLGFFEAPSALAEGGLAEAEAGLGFFGTPSALAEAEVVFTASGFLLLGGSCFSFLLESFLAQIPDDATTTEEEVFCFLAGLDIVNHYNRDKMLG